MKRILILMILALLPFAGVNAQQKKIVTGFDGGMMLHTGYLSGSIPQLGFKVAGAPIGIGGVARVHLGNHFRVGSEGYMSNLPQLGNGSYVKYGWGGLLGDFYWTFGNYIPYAGLTLGGGGKTTYLMFEEPEQEWAPVPDAVFKKQPFMALVPFVGCEFVVSKAMHLTVKADWMCCMGRGMEGNPAGPRVYFGFIFSH